MSILRTANGILDLFPGTSIRIIRNNPIFVDDVLKGDYSLPFNLPATENNKQLLGWLDIPEMKIDILADPYVNIFYEEETGSVLRGKLYIKRANSDNYESYLLIGLSELGPVKDKKLELFNYGGDREVVSLASTNQSFTWKFIPKNQSRQFILRLNEIQQCAPYNYVAGTDANTVLNALKTIIENQITADGGYNYQAGKTLTIVVTADQMQVTASWVGSSPLLDIHDFWEELGNNACYPNPPQPWGYLTGLTVLNSTGGGDAVTIPAWEAFMNAKLTNPHAQDFIFFPVNNSDSQMQDPWGHDLDPIVQNYWEAGSFKCSLVDPTGGSIETSVNKPVTPFPRMLYVLKQVLDFVGYRYAGDITQIDYEFMEIFLYSNYSYNYKRYVQNASGKYADKMNLKNNVPDVTVEEFINWIKKTFCIIYFPRYNDKTIEIVPFKDIWQGTEIIDLSSKVSGKPTVVYDKHDKGFKFSFAIDGNDEYLKDKLPSPEGKIRLSDVDLYSDLAAIALPHRDSIVFVHEKHFFYYPLYTDETTFTWQFYSLEFQPETIGGGEQEVNIGGDTLANFTISFGGTRVYQIPLTGYKMQELGMDNEDRVKPGIRALFYRGMQPQYTGGDYPLGSYNDASALQGTLPGTQYVMSWKGDKGLYNVFWKDFCNWRQTAKEVEVDVFLTAVDFANIDLKKKYHINGTNYFIKEIDISFPVVAPAKVTLVKIAQQLL